MPTLPRRKQSSVFLSLILKYNITKHCNRYYTLDLYSMGSVFGTTSTGKWITYIHVSILGAIPTVKIGKKKSILCRLRIRHALLSYFYGPHKLPLYFKPFPRISQIYYILIPVFYSNLSSPIFHDNEATVSSLFFFLHHTNIHYWSNPSTCPCHWLWIQYTASKWIK